MGKWVIRPTCSRVHEEENFIHLFFSRLLLVRHTGSLRTAQLKRAAHNKLWIQMSIPQMWQQNAVTLTQVNQHLLHL